MKTKQSKTEGKSIFAKNVALKTREQELIDKIIDEEAGCLIWEDKRETIALQQVRCAIRRSIKEGRDEALKESGKMLNEYLIRGYKIALKDVERIIDEWFNHYKGLRMTYDLIFELQRVIAKLKEKKE